MRVSHLGQRNKTRSYSSAIDISNGTRATTNKEYLVKMF